VQDLLVSREKRERNQDNWKGRINHDTLLPVEESVIER